MLLAPDFSAAVLLLPLLAVALGVAALAVDDQVRLGECALGDDGALGAVPRTHLPLPQQEMGRLEALPDVRVGSISYFFPN